MLAVGCLLALPISQAPAADSYAIHHLPVRGDEQGVLVLCPGMNGDGAFFLEEEPWTGFAREHGLGLIAIAFRSDPDGLYDPGNPRGYYYPDQGSGQALLDHIVRLYGRPLPITLYGFSGGAHFTSRFAEWVPDRVTAFAAYSAQFWDHPERADPDAPPGIIACGDLDGVRWFPSFAYFYAGREHQRPWIWINLPETGHVRHGRFEAFVRSFFGSIHKKDKTWEKETVFADVASLRTFNQPEAALHPALLSVFHKPALLSEWLHLHQP
ncbi:MAG: hypothetical protein ACFE0O_14500 [Opitutales bacterium]